MKEIVKIQERSGIPTVNARDLHEYLESRQEFANWIKGRIEKYDFIENADFLTILSKSTGGRPCVEYYLTLTMAKELAMVENNDHGKKIRKYFIMIEEAYRKGNIDKKQLREKSKEVRRFFTDTLKDHGYDKQHYFIQTTKQMRKELGVSGKKDEMSKTDLKKIMAAEMISEINLEQSDAFGYYEVNPICLSGCRAVIEATQIKKQIA